MDGFFFEKVELAIKGGVRLIEIREKGTTTMEFFKKAETILKICRDFNAGLIVNDRVDIALATGAIGVHLGREDLPVSVAKSIFNGIVGWTARSPEEAIQGEREGADYIGAGSVFMSSTKEAIVIGIDGLRRIKRAVNIPVVAVGGINRENVHQVMETGVDGIAVSKALFEGNPFENAKYFRNVVGEYVSY